MKKVLLLLSFSLLFGISHGYTYDNYGCCSSHGGIGYLGSRGAVICKDGWPSSCSVSSYNYNACGSNGSSCLLSVNPNLCDDYDSDGSSYLQRYLRGGFNDSSVESNISSFISTAKRTLNAGANTMGGASETYKRYQAAEMPSAYNVCVSVKNYYIKYQQNIEKEKQKAIDEYNKAVEDYNKQIEAQKKLCYDLIDTEKRAYEYTQTNEIDKAYNLYKDFLSHEGECGLDYSSAKTNLSIIERIKAEQKEKEEAEKAQKKAEEKAKADAEQKAYLEEVEKAKTALGKDAPIIESISKAPKLQDKKMREKILALCQSWKKSNKARNKNFGIYLEYLLTKED